jgi:hypothetical protein
MVLNVLFKKLLRKLNFVQVPPHQFCRNAIASSPFLIITPAIVPSNLSSYNRIIAFSIINPAIVLQFARSYYDVSKSIDVAGTKLTIFPGFSVRQF